jgi:hypothetical protein
MIEESALNYNTSNHDSHRLSLSRIASKCEFALVDDSKNFVKEILSQR